VWPRRWPACSLGAALRLARRVAAVGQRQQPALEGANGGGALVSAGACDRAGGPPDRLARRCGRRAAWSASASASSWRKGANGGGGAVVSAVRVAAPVARLFA
jgi:hypothetical protein